MSEPKGLFIVVECDDSAFGVEQVKNLEAHFHNTGFETETYLFPIHKNGSNRHVENYLSGSYGSVEAISSYKASVFYAINHFEAASAINNALSKGRVVLATNYSGSHMATESVKFVHPEERRGYYIWNDNFEFQVLNIPRPTKNYVLITQNSKTNVENAYKDLCQLFPRDFQQIDCMRDGEPLPSKTIADMLWKRVETFLPDESKKKQPGSTGQPENVLNETNSLKLDLPSVSHLLLPLFAKYRYSSTSKNDSDSFYVPTPLDENVESQYTESIAKIYQYKTEVFEKLVKYLQSSTQSIGDKQAAQIAADHCRALLPAATQQSLALSLVSSEINHLVAGLSKMHVPEANVLVGKIVQQVDKQASGYSLDSVFSSSTGMLENDNEVDKILRDQAAYNLSNTYGQHERSVHLVQKNPRNEFDLIPELLYVASNLSQREIQTGFEEWPYDKKEEVLTQLTQRYLESDTKGLLPLESISYEFDIVCDFTTYMQLNQLLSGTAVRQDLTPSYGYAVPSLIEDAGLVDVYEDCFDRSLELYSILQQAKVGAETQYAVLGGHRLRFKVQVCFRDIKRLLENSHQPKQIQELFESMLVEISQVHPLLAEAMKFVN